MIVARFSGTEFGLLPTRTPQGADMADMSTGESEHPLKETAANTEKPRRRLKWKALKILFVVVLLVVAALVAQGAGLVPPIVSLESVSLQSLHDLRNRAAFLFGVKDTKAATNPPHAVFSRIAAADLMSTTKLLETVGRSPVDPSRVLFAAFEKSVLPGDPSDPKACPPGPDIPELEASKQRTPSALNKDADPVKVASIHPSGSSTSPTTGETAESRKNTPPTTEPGPAEPDTAPAKKPVGKQKRSKTSKPSRQKDDVDARLPAVTTREKGREPKKSEPAGVEPSGAMTASEADKKPEKYQLPGSLVINVENYKGSLIKWGLLAILDDSRSMARSAKPWDTNRMNAAQTILSQLPGILTPGSKFAVRDFYCGRSKSGKKRRQRCLSHTLFPWAEPPFEGLKERLEAAAPRGINSPCAAAAFALKKDFSSIGEVVPRVLLVTGGATRCSYKKVLQAVDRKGARGRVRVDVIALGMGKRSQKGYSILAKKTRGVFLHAEKPAEVDEIIARYEKSLKKPAMKKMEVIGEKTSFKVANGEEITLAPGTYKISLPPIRGLDLAKRTVEGIEVNSGENSVLRIRIKKGRLLVKTAKR